MSIISVELTVLSEVPLVVVSTGRFLVVVPAPPEVVELGVVVVVLPSF